MRGKHKTHLSQRGRPISKKSAGRKGKKKQRKDKGRPRWTAYLLWSTRRRKEIAQENPEYTFAQVGKAISEGWKEVEKEKRWMIMKFMIPQVVLQHDNCTYVSMY